MRIPFVAACVLVLVASLTSLQSSQVDAQISHDGCVFVNRTLGVRYNLTSLHSDTTDLSVVHGGFSYYLNPCSRVLNSDCLSRNPNAAVCQRDNQTWTELAEYRNSTTRAGHHTTHLLNTTDIAAGIVFSYDNAPCNATTNYTTRIIFACNRTIIGNISYVDITRTNACGVDFKVSSSVACGIVFGPSSSSSSSSSTGSASNSSSSTSAYSSSSSSSSSAHPFNFSSTAISSSIPHHNGSSTSPASNSSSSSSSSSSTFTGPSFSSSSSSSTGSAVPSENTSSHASFTAFGFGVGIATGLGVAGLVALLYCMCKRKRHPYSSINGGARNALLDDDFQ